MVDLDKITHAERQTLFAQLTTMFLAGIPVDLPPYNWAISFRSDLIHPGEAKALSCCPQISFRLEKLVLFETEKEVIEHENEYEYQNVGSWWRPRKEKVLVKSREHKSIRITPRSAWSIESAFVGQKLVMPNYTSANGELFRLDGPVGFLPLTCEPPLALTICVQNRGNTPEECHGVFLGRAQ